MSDIAKTASLVPTGPGSDFPAKYDADMAAIGFATNLHVSTAVTLAKNADMVLADATTAAFSVTLPATPSDGDTYTVKKTDSSANAVTVDGNGNNIDGAGTYALSAQYNRVTVSYDSTDGLWYIVSA